MIAMSEGLAATGVCAASAQAAQHCAGTIADLAVQLGDGHAPDRAGRDLADHEHAVVALALFADDDDLAGRDRDRGLSTRCAGGRG